MINNMFKFCCKKVIFALIFIIGNISLYGCFDSREVDELAYVMAMGVDKGKVSDIKVTFQLAVPAKVGSGEGENGGGGGGGSESTTITSVEAPTIYSALEMINSYISKQISLAHAKAIVFSEEIATEDLTRYIYAVSRGREFRPDIQVIVSMNKAEDFIKNVKPKFEINPAKYYEMLLNSYSYTGVLSKSPIIDFFEDAKSIGRDPVAVLAALNMQSSEDKSPQQVEQQDMQEQSGKTPQKEGKNEAENAGQSKEQEKTNEKNKFKEEIGKIKDKKMGDKLYERDFYAGILPRDYEDKSEVLGLAVFKSGKMAGFLDGEETIAYNMIKGLYNYAYMTFKDPEEKDKYFVLNVKKSRKPAKKVKIEDGMPNIDVKLELEADILSIQSGKNYEDPKKLHLIEDAATKEIKTFIERFLDKTSKQLNADICGFGEIMKARCLTMKQWEETDWQNIYKNSKFNVDVKIKIRRPGLLIKSVNG